MSSLVTATGACFGAFLGLALIASFAGPLSVQLLLVGSAALLLALALAVMAAVKEEARE